MGYWLNPWMHCPDCAKLHTRDQVSPTTVCSCGRSLWPLVFDVRPGQPTAA